MYLELRKKIRQYKATDEFQIEPSGERKDMWDYDITLSKDTHPFLSTYLDLTKKLTYNIDGLDVREVEDKENVDEFAKEYYGQNGVITNLIDAEHVDDDWLTGVFLAQQLIPELTFNQFYSTVTTWHNGCHTGLLRGFHHFVNNSKYTSKKKVEWCWKGTDIQENDVFSKKKVFIGAVGTGDVTVGSNLVYLGNKIKENWKDGADVLFHDIYPKTMEILFSGILSSMLMLNNKGYLVLRLPEPEKWNTNTTNIILILGLMFKTLKLWSPPWGRRANRFKYYLIASKKKKTIYRSKYRGFLKILKSSFGDKCFVKKSIHEDEKVKEWNIVTQNIRSEMINDIYSRETAVGTYIENLMANLLPLSKKIT